MISVRPPLTPAQASISTPRPPHVMFLTRPPPRARLPIFIACFVARAGEGLGIAIPERGYVRTYVYLASFPGSPSFRAIIPRVTFDPPEGKAEREPGRFCHMTSVMPRHPYIRYRRGRTRQRLCLYTLCIVGIVETKLFALSAVHPAYACEATTAKEPARSQVA